MAEKTMYLPTVDGLPARFCNDYQLCIAGGRNWHVVPVASLREVRKQIARTLANRKRDGLSLDSRYGYVLIRVNGGSRG